MNGNVDGRKVRAEISPGLDETAFSLPLPVRQPLSHVQRSLQKTTSGQSSDRLI